LPVSEIYILQVFAFKIVHDDACQCHPTVAYMLYMLATVRGEKGSTNPHF